MRAFIAFALKAVRRLTEEASCCGAETGTGGVFGRAAPSVDRVRARGKRRWDCR